MPIRAKSSKTWHYVDGSCYESCFMALWLFDRTIRQHSFTLTVKAIGYEDWRKIVPTWLQLSCNKAWIMPKYQCNPTCYV